MKKIILFLSAVVMLTSCTKDKYTISGTATGFENGKTVILETPNENGSGLTAIDTVKIENGKFEIKGKAIEPSFHTIQVEGVQGKIPFILENGDITIVVNKDSIQKSKVSGTYNNDETDAEDGIPLIRKIPIIGNLFKYKSKSDTRNEMSIFLTPTILE